VRRTTTDPLEGTDRLLIDGTNLLHAIRRGPGAEPPSAVIGRLRGVMPAGVGIELVLDGPPDPGMHGARIAAGVVVRHAGRRSADEVLLQLVDEARSVAGGTAEAVDNLLVVTDDQPLRDALRRRGARSAGTRWLINRLDRGRLVAPTTGNRRPPRPQSADGREASSAGGRDQEAGWRPGRGATAKRGNPKRRRKRAAED
jgi:hypothetical protein